ncbi:MAG: hypothetical protein KF901_21250 [Myxococcales bacterium]|nr:hypothetical protein [Myxococcales bacterium]
MSVAMPRLRCVTGAALSALLILVACGGSSGGGAACVTADDCEPTELCLDGTCRPRATTDAGPLSDGSPDDADTSSCDPACGPGQLCRFDTCVPDLGPCATNDDCRGDSYCSADGECLPYGVPPDVINDPSCRRRDVLDEILPTLQCEWGGPADPATDPEPRSRRIYTAPLVADLNLNEDRGRPRPSIVVTTWYQDNTLGPDTQHRRRGMLRVFDGRTCEEQLNFGGPGDEENTPAYGAQWTIIDLDGDVPAGGRPELVGLHRTTVTPGAATRVRVYAVKIDVVDGVPTARRLWYGRDCDTGVPVDFGNNANVSGLLSADLDDDGHPEIIAGTMVFDDEGCLLNEPGAMSSNQFYAVADVDGDGRVELVTGDRIAEWDPAVRDWIDEPYFEPAAEDRIPGSVAIVDLGQFSALEGVPTPNTLPEIVVVSNGSIRVQDLRGNLIYGPRAPYSSPGVPSGNGGAPTASDFDGDGQVEFAAAANEFYTVYDLDCDADPDVSRPERPGGRCERAAALPEGILWAQPSLDFSSSRTGSSIFDFNGDGRAEAVYSDECYARVYDGATGEVLFSYPTSHGTGTELPVIADVDGDFATEIVVTRTDRVGDCAMSDPLFPSTTFERADGFVVLQDPEDRWANSRMIWNQHAYSVTHVTEDGQVVRTRDWEMNWTTPGLNNFRQNVQGNLGLLDIADLTVVFHGISAICEATLPAELPLSARVCNRGTNPVEDGVLVHFVEGDTLVCDVRTTRFLVPGECEEVTCEGVVTSVDELLVRVDPDDAVADCRPGNDEGYPAAQACLI